MIRFLRALFSLSRIECELREAKAELFQLRGKVRAMANELANLTTAIADTSTKLDALAARVAALPPAGVDPAAVQAAADAVTALGPKIDAIAPATPATP